MHQVSSWHHQKSLKFSLKSLLDKRDFINYDHDEVKKCIEEVKEQKELRFKEELESIEERSDVNQKMRRTLDLLQEKGSGAWLTA